MAIELPEAAKAVHRKRLEHGHALARKRLVRLNRELVRLERHFGTTAPEATRVRERRDRQKALVSAMRSRVELFVKGSD